LASNGTLFLDEIGDLDPSLQSKLLRVLEDGGYERLGGTVRLVSEARVLAATARPVMPGQAGATLREDLYYRLGVVKVNVPALRERRRISLFSSNLFSGECRVRGASRNRPCDASPSTAGPATCDSCCT
jgi:transcriptional regulator with PAS, ATPase and Fis domain